MRILFLTAHLSDVDVAQRALERSPQGPVLIEACASVRDAGRSLAQTPADGILVDLSAAQGDAHWIRELRPIAPSTAIIALLRSASPAAAADALLAGADDTLLKQREYYLQVPTLVAQTTARLRLSARRDTDPILVLLVGGSPAAMKQGNRLQIVTAGDDWWQSPADKTTAVRPHALVLDDGRGIAMVITAIKALRDAGRFEPVVLITDTTNDDERTAYRRLGVTACLPRTELARLPDVVERAVQTTRLEDELTLLRAKEQRLRALIETIPTPVALVGAEGTVQAMNLAGLTLIGARESTQIVGKPFTTLAGDNDSEGVKSFVAQVCGGTPGLVRFSGKGIDGEPRVFEFRSVPLRRERDASSALGVMRVVPPNLAGKPVQAAMPAVETRAVTHASGEPTLDALRDQLESKQKAHDSLQARLAELEAQRAVSDAAWNAVQSQLERTLLLQAAHEPENDNPDAATVSRLEQELKEKDAHLLALAEERNMATARFEQLEAAHTSAESLLEERAALLAQLQETLSSAETSRGSLEEALAQHTARVVELEQARAREQERLDETLATVASLQEQLADAAHAREHLEREIESLRAVAAGVSAERDGDRTLLQGAMAELAALRAQSDAHSREQATLADVRQQMTRLQDEAAALEQLKRDLDESTSRAERLQQALEDALGARTDLQQQVREFEQATLRHGVELAQARATLESTYTERTALKEQLVTAERRAADLEAELAQAREALADGSAQAKAEIVALRARVEEAEAHDPVQLRAEIEAWKARCLGAEDACARLHDELRAASAGAQQHGADLASLRLDHENLRIRVAAADAELMASADAAHVTSLELAQLERERDEMRARLATLDAELRAAADGAHTASLELTQVQRERDEARAQVAPLAAELRAAVDAAHGTGLDFLLVERERDALRQQLDPLANELRAAVDAAQALGVDFLALQRDRDGLATALATAGAHRDQLDAELATTKAELERLAAELPSTKTEIDRLASELAADKAELERLVAATRSADEELAKLQHDRNDAVAALGRERALLADAQEQRVAAEARIAELSTRLAGVEHDLASARETLAAFADERNTLKQSLADLSATHAEGSVALTAARAREDALAAEIVDARAAADAAQREVGELRAVLEAARRDHETAHAHALTLQSAAQQDADERARLREHLAQAHAQVADQRRMVAELEAEREHLRDLVARADAGAQLIAGRHIEERETVQRALDDLRAAFADAEARWNTQRAELEQSIAARADAHRRLSDSGVIGLAATTVDGQLLRCNDALARFCGYGRAADLLTDQTGLVLPLPVDWPAFSETLAGATTPIIVESCVQHPDGRVAWLQASATLVKTASQAATLEWTVVDATDRFLRVRQLKQSRRLDAIRELAVSAGHEVVEQLGALQRAQEADDPALRDAARRALARARDVAQQLVTFAQKQARMPQLLDLNETITHLRPTLRRLTGDDVTMEATTAPGALVVSADPGETEQWMTSLVVAARDAMPAGGTLAVTSRALDLATAGSAGERRLTPAAQVSLVAVGLGARQIAVPATLPELVAHRGGTLRASHDALTSTARVDVYLPLVRPTRATDAPFPLLRADLAAQVPDPLG